MVFQIRKTNRKMWTNPCLDICPMGKTGNRLPLLDALLLAWLVLISQAHGLEPELVKAVADVESGVRQGFKTGTNKQGQYAFPMGIYLGCKVCETRDVRNPFVNIEVGVEALARLGAGKNPKTALKKYNKEFSGAYYAQVRKQYWKYRKEGLR